ncbi:DUF2812 domain-containing protein [Vagococcus vulneris]|nr:DUF2812 domain-containing protein [Vagococcus vulneris]
MKIGKRKYLYSRGITFYSELESLRLKQELAKGWQIKKLNFFGFYVFEPVRPEHAEVVIDFYTGKPSEVGEYLDLYEASGWQVMTNYRRKYYFLKAAPATSFVYTDSETYQERIKSENIWLIKWYTIYGAISLLLALFFKSALVKQLSENIPVGLYYFIFVSLIAGILFPLIAIFLISYFRVTYPTRTANFKNPEKFAKRQRFVRDSVLIMLISGGVGGVIGIVVSYLGLL